MANPDPVQAGDVRVSATGDLEYYNGTGWVHYEFLAPAPPDGDPTPAAHWKIVETKTVEADETDKTVEAGE